MGPLESRNDFAMVFFRKDFHPRRKLQVSFFFETSSKRKVQISFSGITSEVKCFQRGAWGTIRK